MNEIRLKNFRCFRDEQTARLAPLTLLVGENSTGKTSFLAMIRALWDVARHSQAVDFKEEPYDLGTFDEIAHYRGGRGGRSDTFEAGFTSIFHRKTGRIDVNRPYCLDVTIGKKGSVPVIKQRHITHGDAWIDERSEKGQPYTLRVGTSRGSWKLQVPADFSPMPDVGDGLIFSPIFSLRQASSRDDEGDVSFVPLSGSPDFSLREWRLLRSIDSFGSRIGIDRPYASAPVRSKPRRTYDPSLTMPDPEGDYVPMYLADAFFESAKEWTVLKKRLESFGKAAGLLMKSPSGHWARGIVNPFRCRSGSSQVV